VVQISTDYIPHNDFGSFSACSAIIYINVDLATPKKTFPSKYIYYIRGWLLIYGNS